MLFCCDVLVFSIFFITYGTYCDMAPAAGAGRVPDANIFQPGTLWRYGFHSTVLLNEKHGSNNKSVGFFITGDVNVASIWGSSLERLLKFEFKSPQLHIRSRKAPAPNGFIQHTSKLETFQNHPFYVLWNKGIIEKILLPKDEVLSLANIKKGIASLFQFQLLDTEIKETDTSGHCTSTYTSLQPDKFQKSKTKCISSDLPYIKNPEVILDTQVDSIRTTKYEIDDSNEFLKKIYASEYHNMFVTIKEDVGNEVEAQQILTYNGKDSVEKIDVNTFEEALEKVSLKDGVVFTQESLLTERETVASEDVKSFSSIVGDYRDSLKANLLGTLVPAKAFINLVTTARRSTKEDISKALGSKKNKAILHQLYDILGYVQTWNSHEAVMKKLHFDNQNQEELSERYLWALSMSSQPNPEIITDLLSRYTKTLEIPEKVKTTLILTIASMTHRLSKLQTANGNFKFLKKVEEAILNGLDYSKNDERYVFLKALENLKSESTIPKLIEIIKNGSLKEGVLAWKALRAMNSACWNEDVLKAATKTFYQLDKKHDSSSRTLAVDVLLDSKPSDKILNELLQYLRSFDKSFEVKQYLWQKIKMISETNKEFRQRIFNIITNSKEISNYNVLAQKGLSTALTRSFMQNPSSNGSLLTVQEMSGGIVKRGIVNIVMDKNGISQEIFSLGIFSGGLNSFLSSDSEDDSEETAVAGMELTVLGTSIRPFTFFTGQGELMGHVWSGTASERTTAYQALAMLQDHLEYLRLGSGFIVELDLKGGTSFDLSGKIEFSLWNRNAESLVEKSAGVVVVGFMKLDTSFIRSQVEFTTSIEPKLNLQTDIDFSSNVNLCMRLTQPDTVFRHNIFKIERIPGSKHRLRIAKYKKLLVPGKTYSLNKKNDDMCSSMFK